MKYLTLRQHYKAKFNAFEKDSNFGSSNESACENIFMEV